MIGVEHSGSFGNTFDFLNKMKYFDISAILNKAGHDGVNALSQATPYETGRAAGSWYYEIKQRRKWLELAWYNSDIEDGFPVVIRLQYGYSTGTGGYVEGRDFINPAMAPIFEDIQNRVWAAVKSA